MSRLCDAHKCGGTVPAARFLCMKHWRLVPLTIQQTINRQYRAGRKDFAFLSDPVYLQACIDAIKHVAKIEGHDIGDFAGNVTSYDRLLRVALKRHPDRLRLAPDSGGWNASYDGCGTSAYQGVQDGAGTTVALVVGHRNTLFAEPNLDHGRRLVACWNACVGISTENLEDNQPVKELAQRYNVAVGLLVELMDTELAELACVGSMAPVEDLLGRIQALVGQAQGQKAGAV